MRKATLLVLTAAVAAVTLPVAKTLAGRLRPRGVVPVAVPTPTAAPVVADTAAIPEPAGSPSARPSPASIAGNVAHERPRARPAPVRPASADDVPGGRLPPRR